MVRHGTTVLRYLAGSFLRCGQKAVLWLLRADQSPRLRTRFVPAILYRRVGVVLRALLVFLNVLLGIGAPAVVRSTTLGITDDGAGFTLDWAACL